MTRVALIADSHFDQSSRLEECVQIHNWIAQDLRERGVDLVLHAGDVFERKSTPLERAQVADWLRDVAELAPVVMVRGNHDAPRDLSIFERLRTRHPIVVEEAAAVHVVAGVAVACLAWPSRASLAQFLRVDSRALLEEGAAAALEHVLRGLGLELARHDGPRILLAHAMVRGSRVSTGQPLVGCDFELGLGALELACADVVCLGHVHMAQAWEPWEGGTTGGDLGTSVLYPGSPRRTAFGEIEDKGYAVLEISDDARVEELLSVRWQRVSTPCAPMLLLEGHVAVGEDGISLAVDATDDVAPAGAEIRLRYETPADVRGRARELAEDYRQSWLAAGAVRVELEQRVIAKTRARAPEVGAAATLADKLQALWRARADEPDETYAGELLAGLGELEVEVRDAA